MIVFALARNAPAPPCNGYTVVRCRDGAARVLSVSSMPSAYGQVTTRKHVRWCDMDGACNGVCSFVTGTDDGDFTIAVGQRISGPSLCPTQYVCKRGRPARCRRLRPQRAE